MEINYELPTSISKIKYSREAAAVRRCHTLPLHGTYEIGGHSFNMLTMLKILHPRPTLPLVWAIVAHDLPERLTGDIPSPVKWFGVTDAKLLEELEIAIGIKIGQPMEKLTQEENYWLMSLDLLELYLWTLDQISMGNQNVVAMQRRIRQFELKCEWIPKPVKEIYNQISRYNFKWEMCPDLGDYEKGDRHESE